MPNGSFPPGRVFGRAYEGVEHMAATAPIGATAYRVFQLVMPTFSAPTITDSLWSLGGVDDPSELVHLAAQAAASL